MAITRRHNKQGRLQPSFLLWRRRRACTHEICGTHISCCTRTETFFIVLSRFFCPFAVRRIPPSYIKLARHCRPFLLWRSRWACTHEICGTHISCCTRTETFFIVLSRFFCPFAVRRIPPSYIKLARHCRPFCYGEDVACRLFEVSDKISFFTT